MGQGLPNGLGDEGHEGMEQLHGTREHISQHPLSAFVGLLVLFVLETRLGQLNIPIAVGVPDEGIELFGGNAQLELVHVLGDFPHQVVIAGEDPFVLQG